MSDFREESVSGATLEHASAAADTAADAMRRLRIAHLEAMLRRLVRPPSPDAADDPVVIPKEGAA